MKYKNAIEKMKEFSGDWRIQYAAMNQLYEDEADARISLRSHGKKPSPGLIDSVISEMNEWIKKVACVGQSEDNIDLLIRSRRGIIFAKYNVVDPVAAEQIQRMRSVMASGGRPIEALTKGGLEALGSMMLGKIAADAQKMEKEKIYPDKEYCPHGVEARKCENQESFSKEIPRSVDDVQFYCKIELSKCSWEGRNELKKPQISQTKGG